MAMSSTHSSANTRMYAHTHKHTYTRTHAHMHTCARPHAHTYTHTRARARTRRPLDAHVRRDLNYSLHQILQRECANNVEIYRQNQLEARTAAVGVHGGAPAPRSNTEAHQHHAAHDERDHPVREIHGIRAVRPTQRRGPDHLAPRVRHGTVCGGRCVRTHLVVHCSKVTSQTRRARSNPGRHREICKM